MKRGAAAKVAMGGVFGALALVIMNMGTLIPGATFVCPMVCMMILKLILQMADHQTAWAWYGAVTVLSLLLSPDKEAAAVFAALGYYPIVKPIFDALKPSILWKAVYFNAVVLLLYWLLMTVLGMDAIAQEFREMGTVLTFVTLVLGNVTMLLVDRLLSMKMRRKK